MLRWRLDGGQQYWNYPHPRPVPAQCIVTISMGLNIEARRHQDLSEALDLFTHLSMEDIPPHVLTQLIAPTPGDTTTIVLTTCGISGSGKSTLAKSICNLENFQYTR